MDEKVLANLDAGKNTASVLNEQIQTIWRDLGEHPQYLPAGLDIDLGGPPPFVVRQPAAGVGIVEGLVVAALGALAKDAADTLWKEVVWPALKSRVVGLKERK